jgi:hypothetical protein
MPAGAVAHQPSTPQGIASRVAPQRFAGRRPRGGVAGGDGGDRRAAGGVVRAPDAGARPAVRRPWASGGHPGRPAGAEARQAASRPLPGTRGRPAAAPGARHPARRPAPEAGRPGVVVVVERRPARRHRVIADRAPLDRPVSPEPTPPARRPVRRHHPRPPRPEPDRPARPRKRWPDHKPHPPKHPSVPSQPRPADPPDDPSGGSPCPDRPRRDEHKRRWDQDGSGRDKGDHWRDERERRSREGEGKRWHDGRDDRERRSGWDRKKSRNDPGTLSEDAVLEASN